MNETTCPICRLPGATGQINTNKKRELAQSIECPRCGRYQHLLHDASLGDPATEGLLPYLAAHVRQQNAAGHPVVEIQRDWAKDAQRHKDTAVPTKLDLLLRWCAQKSEHPGAIVTIADADNLWPLFDARNVTELHYLTAELEGQGLLETKVNGRYKVTAHGWERLSSAAHPHGIPGRVFVAMPFNDVALDAAYEAAILPALDVDCGLTVVRLDREEHNANINDQMLVELRAAQFVVAEFAKHRPNVYFEAGFALGLGRPVVWLCHEDHHGQAHFDTRAFNHIVWANHGELRQRLTARVRATIPGAKLAAKS